MGDGGRAAPVSSETRLSMGRRFIAFDVLSPPDPVLSSSNLVLYDTEAGTLSVVERHPRPDLWTMQRGWTVVAGDLLVFRRVYLADDANASRPAEICWAILPGPGA